MKNLFFCSVYLMGWLFLSVMVIVVVYFFIIGVGYGTSTVLYSATYNLTDGKCLDKNIEMCYEISCYYNQQHPSSLYAGCMLTGILSTLVLTGIITMISLIMGLSIKFIYDKTIEMFSNETNKLLEKSDTIYSEL